MEVCCSCRARRHPGGGLKTSSQHRRGGGAEEKKKKKQHLGRRPDICATPGLLQQKKKI